LIGYGHDSLRTPATITSLQGATGSGFTPHVDTPQSAGQTLAINGANLTAAGQSDPPQSPSSGEHPYSDAIAIKSYNSGPPSVARPTGAYIYFANAWSFNTLSNASPPFDYVYRVCTAAP